MAARRESIPPNIAEGNGVRSLQHRNRFFDIAGMPPGGSAAPRPSATFCNAYDVIAIQLEPISHASRREPVIPSTSPVAVSASEDVERILLGDHAFVLLVARRPVADDQDVAAVAEQAAEGAPIVLVTHELVVDEAVQRR